MKSMKQSGVVWLGEIPKDWNVKRIKNLFELRNEKNFEALDDVNLISLYTEKGVIQHCDLEKTSGNKAVTAEGYKKVYKDDIVVNIILCWMGAIGRSDYNGVTSPAYDIYKPKGSTLSKYYHYLFRTKQFNGECYRYGRGIMLMRWRTYSDEFSAIQVPYPPIEEQYRIIKKLDARCSKIDALISNQQKQIEKLKQYKQLLITEVVTKGLDPSVPMKDSGVEWINMIPKEWDIIKIKHTSWLKGRIGWDGLKSTEFTNDGPYLITGTDFSNGSINWNTCTHISEERFWEDELLHIKEGDLLITKDGTIGKLAIVKNCPKQVSLNSGVMIIRNDLEFKYYNKYLYYVLQSNQFLLWYELSQSGNSTIRHLYQGQFYEFKYTYPDLKEQRKIADYLDSQCNKIDKLLEDINIKISKLNQYKQSLIYEYVTGKKEA